MKFLLVILLFGFSLSASLDKGEYEIKVVPKTKAAAQKLLDSYNYNPNGNGMTLKGGVSSFSSSTKTVFSGHYDKLNKYDNYGSSGSSYSEYARSGGVNQDKSLSSLPARDASPVAVITSG